MTELEALVTLNQLPQIGPVRIKRLIAYFGSAEAVLDASASEIAELPLCSGEIAQRIANWSSITNAEQELDECDDHGIAVITPNSPNWPPGISEAKNAPVLLYVWGTLPDHRESTICVVGSRKTSNYGRVVTEQFSKHLAANGQTIISGLALGIDTIAHHAALEMGQRTIAVLGSGLASLYPKQNQELAQAISQQGAVVSEYPLKTHPDKQTFPQRNRIVAAWSDATLVTEMPARSGAMITAKYARDCGRPIYAIPGPIDRPSSAGCHQLIREGATLVTSPEQITAQLRAEAHQQITFDLGLETATRDAGISLNLTEVEAQVLELLTLQEQSIDELHQSCPLPIHQLTTTLLSLELQDLARQHVGMTYTRAA